MVRCTLFVWGKKPVWSKNHYFFLSFFFFLLILWLHIWWIHMVERRIAWINGY